MINDNTILSSFDDKPTLLEWLKKVEDALKTDTATAVSVENPSANTYVFKITFADGTALSSGNVVFPDSVKDVSIKNGHIIVTSVGGNVEDLGVLNPYAGTIVENASTNTTEIGNNVEVGGRLQVNSSIISNGEIRGGNISGTKFLLGTEEMPLVKANPTGEATQTLEKIKIGDVAYNVGGGGGGSGIVKRELVLNLQTDFTDITQPSKQTTLQLTETGAAKYRAFVEGIEKGNIVSLYCSIFTQDELIPGVTEAEIMYGTFNIPATLATEGAPGLNFVNNTGTNFSLIDAGEGTYMFILSGSGTTLSYSISSLSFSIFYLQ